MHGDGVTAANCRALVGERVAYWPDERHRQPHEFACLPAIVIATA